MASTENIEAFLAEPRNVVVAELPRFRAIREKHGMRIMEDGEHRRALEAERRVLLAIIPDAPLPDWTAWGLD